MPLPQTANIGCYGFGAPSVEGVALQFTVRRGGRISVRVVNQGDATLTVTLQVSADGSTWADTAATPHGTAVADQAIPVRQYRDYDVNLRHGQDNFLRLQAVGGVRGELEIRGDEILQVKQV